MEASPHFIHSTLRERIVEHVFVGEVLRRLWQLDVTDVEVLRSEFDVGGYDLVMSYRKIVRHIQLKTVMLDGKAANTKVSLKLMEKPSGCVIWIILTPQLQLQSYQRHQANVAEIKARGGRQLNILADGDSWFNYPLSRDVIDWLRADGNPSPEILDLAVAGDPVTATLGVTKRQRIIDNLTNPANGTFDALLFSGGGDDIAGDQFCFWLTDKVAGSNGINAASLGDILGVVQTGYHDLFTTCGKYAPNCKIFVHGYDYARATGVGACPLPTGGYVAGPWLKPSLDYRSWTSFNDAAVIIKTILQQFEQLLLQLENQYKPQVTYVRTQGTLIPPSSINDKNSDWANELHPTDSGFGKIAAQFLAALKHVFPGRI